MIFSNYQTYAAMSEMLGFSVNFKCRYLLARHTPLTTLPHQTDKVVVAAIEVVTVVAVGDANVEIDTPGAIGVARVGRSTPVPAILRGDGKPVGINHGGGWIDFDNA